MSFKSRYPASYASRACATRRPLPVAIGFHERTQSVNAWGVFGRRTSLLGSVDFSAAAKGTSTISGEA
jgi:hypothetical protein